MKLTKEYLNQLFEYRDGVLYWRINHKNAKAGTPAGSKNNKAGSPHAIRSGVRLRTTIDGAPYYNHRLIYLMHHGVMPKYIDHINQNPLDNRIENLREATCSQNNANRLLMKNNQSGAKGVFWNKRLGKWQAQIKNNRQCYHLGLFETIEEAKEVVEKARQQMHGEFANNG